MLKKRFVIIVLIACFSILTGCESKQEIDTLIQDYVKEKHGFNVKIINRESKNEGNMGDRTYLVKQTTDPEIQFSVYLSGMLSSTIEGDNYQKQKEAYEYAQQFITSNEEKLLQSGYSKLVFSTSTNGLVVSAASRNEISLQDSLSIDYLLAFINSLNRFQAEMPHDEKIASVKITHTESNQFLSITDINEITDKDALVGKLNEDTDFVNYSLFKRDFTDFQAMENELYKIGYKLKSGLTVGMVDESIYCYGKNITSGECTGGFEIKLNGPTDAKSLYTMVEALKKQNIKIKDVVIPGKPMIMLENIDNITSVQQIKLMLTQ